LTRLAGARHHDGVASFTHGMAAGLLGAGLGVQVFLSFLVAPAAFRLIDRAEAVRLMEGVFPGYYRFGLVVTAAALALVALLAWAEGRSPLRWGTIALLALAIGGTLYAGSVLLPEAHAARLRAQAAGPGDRAPLEFSRLHRRAVAVNIAVFGVGLLAFLVHLGAPPRGTPIPSAGPRSG
jgi:hypothetical protein